MNTNFLTSGHFSKLVTDIINDPVKSVAGFYTTTYRFDSVVMRRISEKYFVDVAT